MPIPTDYIFTSGSCRKDAIYDLIINTLLGAGWTNVSSLATSDFVVLQSPGNTGDKQLLLNLRDTSSTNANSVKTTAYCVMSYRLQDTYTPGAAGVAGTFGRLALAWTNLYIAPVAAVTTTLAVDTIVNYKVYADASKIILTLQYPSATALAPMVIYMGQPDTTYAAESGSKGVLVATSTQGSTATSVMICNTSDGIGTVTAPYAMATQALLPGTNPNSSGKYAVSDIYYSSTSEGIRGKLDGLLCMLNSNILTGDNITINGQTYYIVTCHTQGITSFPSQALLVRIA